MAEQTIGDFAIPDQFLMACTYCEHNAERGGARYCANPESPYASEKGHGALLTTEQKFTGCEKLSHNGEQMPSVLFPGIPQESALRLLPPQEIITDYDASLDLKPRRTLADLVAEVER